MNKDQAEKYQERESATKIQPTTCTANTEFQSVIGTIL